MPGMAIGGGTGRIGGAGILASPNRRIGSVSPTGPWGSSNGARPFRSQPLSTTHTAIWGVTRRADGTVIPNCLVQLFRNQPNLFSIGGGPTNFITIQLRVTTPQPYAAQSTAPGTAIFPTPGIPGELVEETRSDANGNYIFWSPHVSGPFWIVAWQDQDGGPTLGWSGATNKDLQPEFLASPPF